MRPLITRSVCTHTVYYENSCYHTFWAILYFIYIIHFVIELFFLFYIHKLITILTKKINHARDSIISSNCQIRSNCKWTASVYLLLFWLLTVIFRSRYSLNTTCRFPLITYILCKSVSKLYILINFTVLWEKLIIDLILWNLNPFKKGFNSKELTGW